MNFLKKYISLIVISSFQLNSVPAFGKNSNPESDVFADQALAVGAVLQLHTKAIRARENLIHRFHSLVAFPLAAGTSDPYRITLKLPRLPLFRGIADPQIPYRSGMTWLQLLEALPLPIRERFIQDAELDPHLLLTRSEIGVAEAGQPPTWGAALQDEIVRPGKNDELILRGDDFLAAVEDVPKERTPRILQASLFFMIAGAIVMLLGYPRYGAVLLLIGIKIIIELKTPPPPGSGNGMVSVVWPWKRRPWKRFRNKRYDFLSHQSA